MSGWMWRERFELQISIIHQVLKLILWVFVRQNVQLRLLSATVLAVAASSLRLVNISPCSTQRSHVLSTINKHKEVTEEGV